MAHLTLLLAEHGALRRKIREYEEDILSLDFENEYREDRCLIKEELQLMREKYKLLTQRVFYRIEETSEVT